MKQLEVAFRHIACFIACSGFQWLLATCTALDPCLTHTNINTGETQHISISQFSQYFCCGSALLTIHEQTQQRHTQKLKLPMQIAFPAVTLLTSTEGMTGGQTVLKKGDDSEMSVGFPQAGYLLVLQVCHCPVNAFLSYSQACRCQTCNSA